MIAHALSALRRTGRIAVERPRAALWTLLALTCAMLVAAVAALVAANVDRWASAPRTDESKPANMVVYLGDHVTGTRAVELVAELRQIAGVEHVELVTAAESSKRLVKALGDDAALLEGVDVASLPASIEIRLVAGVQDVVAMSPTVRALRASPDVASIAKAPAPVAAAPQKQDSSRLPAFAWTCAALLAGLALLVSLALVRVRLERGKQETRVLELLGAHPTFTIIPTAFAGAISCAVAALLAVVALVVGVHLWGEPLAVALGHADFVAPAGGQLVLLVAAGAGLGLVGGGLAGASRVAY